MRALITVRPGFFAVIVAAAPLAVVAWAALAGGPAGAGGFGPRWHCGYSARDVATFDGELRRP